MSLHALAAYPTIIGPPPTPFESRANNLSRGNAAAHLADKMERPAFILRELRAVPQLPLSLLSLLLLLLQQAFFRAARTLRVSVLVCVFDPLVPPPSLPSLRPPRLVSRYFYLRQRVCL